MQPVMTPGAAAPPRSRLQTFRALRHRDFRLLWVGLVVSAVGTWMQIIAQSLLVLRLSHGSAFQLGVVSLAQAASFFLFAIVGGSVADRVDKRRLLLVTQTLAMLLAFALGVLTVTGVIRVWMIVALAFVSGTILSFDQPTRSALVPQLVPDEDLMNAISLQSVIFNGASVVGPALAGALVGIIGIAGNFFLNGVSFLGVLVVLYLMHIPHNVPVERRGSLLHNVSEALGAVRRDVALPWMMSGYAALLFLGPSSALMLPVFATKILHLGDVQFGLLFAAAGVGTVVGALLIASLGDAPHKGRLMLGSALVWAAGLILFGLSQNFYLSIAGLFIYGLAQNGVSTTTITMMQTRVPPRMRGRVMSLNTLMIMGIRPLGDFPAGALISGIGAPVTVLLSASLVAAYTLYLAVARPALREV